MDSDNYSDKECHANSSEVSCAIMQDTNTNMQTKQNRWLYAIEERRREVAQMLTEGHSETEIAQLLHVHVSTICRDVKFLKQLSQRFIFDLAKGDLTYYYK
jgi:DNA-binding NarL/FixJ family response regulator